MKAMQLSETCTVSLFLLLAFFVSINAQSTRTICNNTPFPGYCRSNVGNNQSASIHDCGRNFIHRSISMTNKFLSLFNRYLNLGSALPEPTVRALQDCQTLATLTRDFFLDSILAINRTTNLQSWKADYFQTMLSAALTNHDTCLNGLQEVNADSSIRNALGPQLTNGSQAYSVSLALFKHGWGDKRYSSGRWLGEFNYNKVLSARNAVGRKLLQTSPAGVKVSQIVVVNPTPGKGNFTTIKDAVAAAPNNTDGSKGYFLISIAKGVYQEYVSIPSNKMYIMMIGAGINKTIITGNRSVVDGSTTFNSATFAVVGQGFVAQKITFRNTAGATKMQAVAVRNGADLSTFYQCSFEGYQDTLYAHSMRQFYRKCDIYGTIDFIFGNAAVVFQSCNMYARLPLSFQFNTITAQGKTDINQNTGTSIQNCNITAAPDLASSKGTTRTFLGRPWQNYSTTVYMQSFMDRLIDPAGWAPWPGSMSFSTLYYAEYSNSGPGSVTTKRVTWPGFHVINATVAANFTVANFIQGKTWLPATGVSFASGLRS